MVYQWFISDKTILFKDFRLEGPTSVRGRGVQLFTGGSKCLFL